MLPASIEMSSGYLTALGKDSSAGDSDDATADSRLTFEPGDDEDTYESGDYDLQIGAKSLASGDDKNGDDDDDENGEPEAQDYRGFAALIGGDSTKKQTPSSSGATGPAPNRKQQISSQTIRKGEKDFEEHGTRAQRDALEQSRAVMESVLAHTRVHYGSAVAGGGSSTAASCDVIRGWYFPNIWQDAPDEEEELEEARKARPKTRNSSQSSQDRRFAHTRDRVVMVEANRGVMFSSVGAVPGKPRWIEGVPKAEQPAPRPGCDRTWLLPEEALFLMERGSMELYWPLQSYEALLDKIGQGTSHSLDDSDDSFDLGIPLSLQAAYSLLIGPDIGTPRGRVALPSYQVYTHLRRAGYQVLRAVKIDPRTSLDVPELRQQAPQVSDLWRWLFSFISPSSSSLPSNCCGRDPTSPPPPPHGPLIRPGLYRSYAPIYSQLRLISRHTCTTLTTAVSSPAHEQQILPPDNPFRIVYHVWKAGASAATAGTGTSTSFSKTRPPPPDFFLTVADANRSGIPSLDQVTELLASVPPLLAKDLPVTKSRNTIAAPLATSTFPSSATRFPPLPVIYRRLKLGRRCVIIAVVDHGIVNFMRFADGSFDTNQLWPRFDALTSSRMTAGVPRGAEGRKGKGKSGGGKNQKKKKSAVVKNGTVGTAEGS
ncbi:tRNA-splicing endonuclease subunit sen54 [Sporothrix epigloea]|uniref:tRNA-splicing endonuclease subunit sen54 n=1 Tax=Sporothrix epigloea TaxID=1892477 RepID=A0ABP0E035_9PEZI